MLPWSSAGDPAWFTRHWLNLPWQIVNRHLSAVSVAELKIRNFLLLSAFYVLYSAFFVERSKFYVRRSVFFG
jgi:hypothetical protein